LAFYPSNGKEVFDTTEYNIFSVVQTFVFLSLREGGDAKASKQQSPSFQLLCSDYPSFVIRKEFAILKAGFSCVLFLFVCFLITQLRLHDVFVMKQTVCKLLSGTLTCVAHVTIIIQKQLQ
jgi:hypothetical protein